MPGRRNIIDISCESAILNLQEQRQQQRDVIEQSIKRVLECEAKKCDRKEKKKEHSSSARAYICTTRYDACGHPTIPRLYIYIYISVYKEKRNSVDTLGLECISTLRGRGVGERKWGSSPSPRFGTCVAPMLTERRDNNREINKSNLPNLSYYSRKST